MLFIAILIEFLFLSIIPIVTFSLPSDLVGNFLNDFIDVRRKPAYVISYLEFTTSENSKLSGILSKSGTMFSAKTKPIGNFDEDKAPIGGHSIFVVDVGSKWYPATLEHAQRSGLLLSPSSWIMFYNSIHWTERIYNNAKSDFNVPDEDKQTIESFVKNIYIGINTEVYIAFVNGEKLVMFLIHRKRHHLPYLWRYYGKWTAKTKLETTFNSLSSIAMSRKNMEGLPIVASAVYANRSSLKDSPGYIQRQIDSPTKLTYYMSMHLFEWMNATGSFNITNTWGYKQPDGSYGGIMKELQELRSDFSGTILIIREERLDMVDFVIPIAPLNLFFVFRKPALATTSNIYALPFTDGVWLCTVVLIFILAAAITTASLRELRFNNKRNVPLQQRISDGFFETLCCVFQQGIPQDPFTLSCRVILFLGLMAFMFLYTAYSAYVVALLQSSDNSINSVNTLSNSPLQCGSHDVIYNRFIFKSERRPVHRALWLKKGLTQGENFFMEAEEGIRRVRQGMFAFHVELTTGFDVIQRTFLEHEKCNLETIPYTDAKFSYFGVARNSPIKEALRIGAIRIKESGVQERTNRRIHARLPSCPAGQGMFSPVDLQDVARAIKFLLIVYASAVILLGVEVFYHWRRNRDFIHGTINIKWW